MGNLRSGRPIEALEERENLNIAEVFPVGKRYYVLRVTDDSMADLSIADGDFVIVEKRDEAADGETVIAVFEGGEAALRRVRNGNGDLVLHALGGSGESIDAKNVEIRGVVIGVLRHFANGTSTGATSPGSAPATA